LSNQPTSSADLELDLRKYEVRRNGQALRLERIPMELLILLIEKKEELVAREEIIGRLWGNRVFVDTEQGINTAIRKIRLALRDDPEQSRYVQTVVGKGYRFIGPIKVAGNGKDATTIVTPPGAVSREKGAISAISLAPPRTRIGVGMAAVLVIALLLVFAFNIRGLRRTRLITNPPIHSIAVLPLDNLSGDPSQDYFVDGMTDELITDLAKIKSLRVISRTSVVQYKSAHKSLPEIAQALNVSAVVEGAVSRSGNRVRITAQLIDARTDVHLWAQDFERDLADTMALQSEMAQTIAHQIRVEMTSDDETRLSPGHQANAKAHDSYLQGRYRWNKKTEQGLGESIAFYQQAIAEDPEYALAYAGLADSYIVLENNGQLPPGEANPKIKDAAVRAVEADPSLADGHMVLASAKETEWDWVGAEQEYKRAVELNPGLARAHHWYAILLTELHRPDEAKSEIARAIDLEPVNDRLYLVESHIYFLTRQDEVAQRSLHMLEGAEKNAAGVHEALGLIYLNRRMYGDAISELLVEAGKKPRQPEEWAFLTYAYALAGETNEALQAFAKLTQLSETRFVEPCWMAVAWTGLGNHDKAFYYLNQAYQAHSSVLPLLQVQPVFDPLRSDPRFQELLHRMVLPV
jgi:TolB-like protein/DNA-binding winged helix-turn-helix (wHTH) protein/Tfp pilus assembly protein PilF